MPIITVLILSALLPHCCAANYAWDLTGKLLNRTVKASPTHNAGLDDTAFGKPDHLVIPRRPTSLFCHATAHACRSRLPARRRALQMTAAPHHLTVSSAMPLSARRWGTHSQVNAAVDQKAGFFQTLNEFLGDTGGDPGHRNLSPQWWGSQGGDWGNNEGTTVFRANSEFNGNVTVTSHKASQMPGGREGEVQEWRVLRFNDVTLQSAARVTLLDGKGLRQQPQCLASEYLKSMAAAAAGVLGRLGNADKSLRVLCIGVGGGSLPLFMAHHFPNMQVEGVEIDPVVMQAAREAMGLVEPLPPNLKLTTEDAFHFVQRHMTKTTKDRTSYDLVLIDAFDGMSETPEALTGEVFGKLLASMLEPNRGALVMNVHAQPEGQMDSAENYYGVGPAQNYYKAMKAVSKAEDAARPVCFTLQCREQKPPSGSTREPKVQRVRTYTNTILVAAYGLVLPPSSVGRSRGQILGEAAAEVAGAAGFSFLVSRLCNNKYRQVQLQEDSRNTWFNPSS